MTYTRSVLVLVAALALLAACSATDAPTPIQDGASFGAPCQATEDCGSRLCVRRDVTGGVCTRTCITTSDCPASPNWDCVQPANLTSKVCACIPDSDSEICGDGIDNDCNGRVDDCLSCNGQLVSANDPANCGGCGNQCRADQTCSLGKCGCPPTASTDCSGQCVDTQSSSQHCGSCGTACGTGQSCIVGTCKCDDPSASTYCPGTGCVDTSSDTSNCGSCGNACHVGQACQSGSCVCPSQGTYCDGVGCVDTTTDAFNCGSCGNVCPTGSTCSFGTCTCAYGKPDLCGSVCVDLQTDKANCGTCGTACASAQSCTYGICTCPYTTPNLCGSLCVNLQTDKANCGTCGTTCAGVDVCSAGKCICPVGTPNDCSGTCVNFYSDNNNCGACGNVCPNGQHCSYSTCVCDTYGQTACGAVCVDTKADATNCGTCGTVCPGNQICSASACKCGTGQTWCASANQCFNLYTDASNCGSCGNACSPGQICSGGGCTCPTYTDKWCASAGTCIDVYSDAQNCGNCGTVCPAQTHCSSATCRCDQAGYTLCSGTCFDLQNDPANCGTCGNACAGNQICAAGKCGCPAPVVGAAVRVTTTTAATVDPSTAWDGTHVGLAYLDGTTVMLAILNPDGTRAVTPDQVVGAPASGSDKATTPDITWNGSEYAIVWSQLTISISGYETMLRRYAADGTPKGAAVSITANTSGPPKLTDGMPRVSWSPVYGGYAVASTISNQYIGFQRVGTDGTAPDPVNTYSSNVYSSIRAALAVSPAGEWGLVVGGVGVQLLRYNPDGSRTQAVQQLYPGLMDEPQLVHDGTTWLATWPDATYSPTQIDVNRGEVRNGPVQLTPTANIDPAIATGAPGLLEMMFTPASTTQLALQRFTIPASPTSSALVKFGPQVTVLATNNLLGTRHATSIIHTGSGSLLAVWADNRWGAGELYAAPVDFSSCP